jgi:transcriptional regulator GlxA family with amidase domain
MQVVQFIMSHLDGDLSVAALARGFSLKDRVLLTAFESHTGIALGQFVWRRRIEHALDFLKNTNGSDSEIAMGLGWEYASAFRTAFVNYLGVSPTEYRTSLPPKQAATGLGRRKRPCKSVGVRREESVGQAFPAFVV